METNKKKKSFFYFPFYFFIRFGSGGFVFFFLSFVCNDNLNRYTLKALHVCVLFCPCVFHTEASRKPRSALCPSRGWQVRAAQVLSTRVTHANKRTCCCWWWWCWCLFFLFFCIVAQAERLSPSLPSSVLHRVWTPLAGLRAKNKQTKKKWRPTPIGSHPPLTIPPSVS